MYYIQESHWFLYSNKVMAQFIAILWSMHLIICSSSFTSSFPLLIVLLQKKQCLNNSCVDLLFYANGFATNSQGFLYQHSQNLLGLYEICYLGYLIFVFRICQNCIFNMRNFPLWFNRRYWFCIQPCHETPCISSTIVIFSQNVIKFLSSLTRAFRRPFNNIILLTI
jgi:hypothetical protein